MYVIAIHALAMMDAVSEIPQITRRDVPKAARIEADHRIWVDIISTQSFIGHVYQKDGL